MHFALPPRKTSNPPPYARAAARSSSNARRRTLQLLSYAVLGILTIYLLIHWLSSTPSSPSSSGEIEGPQAIVIVTVLDPETMSPEYMRMIRNNRDDYAARHGYKTFYTSTANYTHLISPSPSSWSLLPALRHALKLHPTSNYLWSLTPHALITSPSLSLESHILHNLTALMQKDIPVVPPDSVIRTFSHLSPSSAHLILSQDMDNLAHTSFLLKNTPSSHPSSPDPDPDPDAHWSHFLLDAWFDPLYIAYAFQKAENHALEHLVQWHATVLAKLVLVPQRTFNSYNFASHPRTDEDGNVREHDSMWAEGDLVVVFKGCGDAMAIERDCEKEMKAYWTRWEREVERLDSREAKGGVDLADRVQLKVQDEEKQ